ncbi:hypothetical protein IAR50_001227 [Cryptococcus sp. DSM 104548]
MASSPGKEPQRSLLSSLRPSPESSPSPGPVHHLHPHDAKHPQPSGSILRRESNSFPLELGVDGSSDGGSDVHLHAHNLNLPSPTGQPRHSALRFQVVSSQSPRSSSSYTRPPHKELLDNDRVIESDSESGDGYVEDEESSSSQFESPYFAGSVLPVFLQRRRSGPDREEESDSSHDPAFWSPLKRSRLPTSGETSTKSPDTDPVRSRSSSRQHPRGRLSDAGPRAGRAGSPMPQPQSGESDDGSSEGSGLPNVSKYLEAGWRSDDPALYGPRKRPVKLQPGDLSSRRFSFGLARPFLHSSDQAPAAGDTLKGRSEEVKSFFRRASEHVPGLSRRSASDHGPVSPSGTNHSSPVPPILDDTPALGIQAIECRDTRGGLAHRLEEALSSPTHSDSPRSAPQ